MRAALLLAIGAIGMLTHGAASAGLDLPELPLPTASPLPDDGGTLKDLLNLDELLGGAVETVGETVKGTTGTVSDLLGVDGSPDGEPGSGPRPAVRAPAPQTDRPPAIGDGATGAPSVPPALAPPARVSSRRLRVPSYAAAVADGIARTARRAGDLAGPFAAPLLLGAVALCLLFVAGRGPGRLVKVEEERKSLRAQRTFRL